MGLLVFSALVIGGIYPAVVQQFVVKPSEADKEGPYIQRNITATRAAYGIVPGEQVKDVAYPGTTSTAPARLRADKGTLPYIRLLDPTLISPTYQSLQGFRQHGHPWHIVVVRAAHVNDNLFGVAVRDGIGQRLDKTHMEDDVLQ